MSDKSEFVSLSQLVAIAAVYIMDPSNHMIPLTQQIA